MKASDSILVPVKAATAARYLRELDPLIRSHCRANYGHVPDDVVEMLEQFADGAAAYRAILELVSAPVPQGGEDPFPDETIDYMNTEQVAEQLGVTPRQVRNYATAGSLIGHLSGRSWQFDPADVAAFMERTAA